MGLPSPEWRRLLRENQVDRGFRHRAAFLSLMSLRNSFYRAAEERRWGEAVRKTELAAPPLFVLGHWRSGTTLLHDLLSCDPRLASPNSAQCCYPHTFLSTEGEVRRRFAGWLPATRPMDNMRMALESPQEDEFALCLAGLKSPYLGMFTFPRRAAHYDRYLTLRAASEEEREAWKADLMGFLRKLTLRHGRPLLLKSPTHTARIRLLLELFPGARFLHVRRNPYAVFRSTLHMMRRMLDINALQRSPDDGELEEQVLARYTELHDAYFAERGLVPEGRLHEIAFEDLERDPVAALRDAYERLGLPPFEDCLPALREKVESLAGYRKNEFPDLPPDLRRRVAARCGRTFDLWQYPT